MSIYFIDEVCRIPALCVGLRAHRCYFLAMFAFVFKVVASFLICQFCFSVVYADLSSSGLDFVLRSQSMDSGLYTSASRSINQDSSNPTKEIWFSSLEYHSKFSEGFHLIWSPLPLGIVYQGQNDYNMVTAVSWNLGIAYLNAWGAKPRFNSFLRRPLEKGVSFEAMLEYFAFVPFEPGPTKGSVGFSNGLRIKVLQNLDIVSAIQVIYNDLAMQSMFATEDAFLAKDQNRITLPLEILLDFKIGESFKLGATYTYRGLGLPASYSSHIFGASLNSAW